MDASQDAVVAADAGGAVTLWNGAAERLFGWPASEMVGAPLERIMPERYRAAHAAGLRRRAESGVGLSGATVEIVGLRRDGSEFPIALTVTSWDGEGGPAFGAQIRDVTEQKAREALLAHRASHDPLTGLCNRAGFEEELERRCAAAGGATLLYADLDQLKLVNDTLGHPAGDALLQTFAVRLRGCLPPGALAARLGGDEFGVLLARADDLPEAGRVAARLLAAAEAGEPSVGGRALTSCSVGVASAPLHAADWEQLLANADLAMIAAKKAGGARVRFFDAGLASEGAARKLLKDELLVATREGQWELHYQPQRSLTNGALTGAEALLRWRHPRRGLTRPAAFLDELERHLVAADVGHWALNEACAQLRRWRDAGHAVPRVSVNLFDAQFRRPDLAADVAAALAAHALEPGDLEIEVTERTALTSGDRAAAGLRSLRDLGVHIAFDDFGTGFASLTTVKQLPLTRLKIDRSFVRDLLEDRQSAAIVDAIVSMARSLDLDVVAEGIETAEQRDALARAGCQHGQGYYLGRPAPARRICAAAACRS